MTLVEATRGSIPFARPEPTEDAAQPLCGDKGYDSPSVRAGIASGGDTAHSPVKKAKGADPGKPETVPGYRARRGVVERTPSGRNRFRRRLLRGEKKVPNYKAFRHCAGAGITYQVTGVLG